MIRLKGSQNLPSKDLQKLRMMFHFLDGYDHDSKAWKLFEHIFYQIPSPLGKLQSLALIPYRLTYGVHNMDHSDMLRNLCWSCNACMLSLKEYDYKIEKWFSQYDGKPYEKPIPWKRFQNASPLYPIMNDAVIFFEMTGNSINDDILRCHKCVMFAQKGIPGSNFPSNITRQISAILVDSDECQKAKTVNTSTCNQARFWCKELIQFALGIKLISA